MRRAAPPRLGRRPGAARVLAPDPYDRAGETSEKTIAWYRQAEIKHGRVAMAAFVGYCVQANGIHFPWTPYPGFEEGLSPPEQWAAIPAAGKWQFLVYIGILEALGECFAPGEHYMAGGKPGVFPSLKAPNDQMLSQGVYPFHGFPLDLFGRRAGHFSHESRATDVAISPTNRGDAGMTWTLRGNKSRRRRGRDVDIPWRRVAATPRLRRG